MDACTPKDGNTLALLDKDVLLYSVMVGSGTAGAHTREGCYIISGL